MVCDYIHRCMGKTLSMVVLKIVLYKLLTEQVSLKSTCPFFVCIFEAMAVDSCHKCKVGTNAKIWI